MINGMTVGIAVTDLAVVLVQTPDPADVVVVAGR